MKSVGACSRHGVGVVMENLFLWISIEWHFTGYLRQTSLCYWETVGCNRAPQGCFLKVDFLLLFLLPCFGCLVCSETQWYENKVQIDARLVSEQTLHFHTVY